MADVAADVPRRHATSARWWWRIQAPSSTVGCWVAAVWSWRAAQVGLIDRGDLTLSCKSQDQLATPATRHP